MKLSAKNSKFYASGFANMNNFTKFVTTNPDESIPRAMIDVLGSRGHLATIVVVVLPRV